MGEFCFVHAANLHLDSPFEGIGLTTPAISTVLRDASLKAWEALVRLTVEREAACLLLAGGLYDGSEYGQRAGLALRDGLETLAARNIPVFIVLGDRDSSQEFSAAADWPDNVTMFGQSPASVPLFRDGSRLATIHGASHVSSARLRDGFRFAADEGPHIGLLHGVIRDEGPADQCTDLTLEELRALPVRYWALGHHHARRVVREDPWIVYPGTPQARSADVDAGACGAMVVQVAGDEVRHVSFEPLDVVRFRSLVIEDGGALQRTELLRQALDRARRLRRENEGRALVLQVSVRTRARSLEEPSEWLISELRSRTPEWSPFVWWTAARGTGEREAAVELRPDRGELGALVLEHSRALLGAALPRSSFLARELAPLRSVWDAELDLEEVKGLLKEATAMALDELGGGQTA